MNWKDILIILVLVAVVGGLFAHEYLQKPKIECPIGAGKIEGKEVEIIGIEKHTIEGRSIDLCCGVVEAPDKKAKICKDDLTATPSRYEISWYADEKTGWEYEKIKEVYPKNGQRCIRIFDPIEGTTEQCF